MAVGQCGRGFCAPIRWQSSDPRGTKAPPTLPGARLFGLAIALWCVLTPLAAAAPTASPTPEPVATFSAERADMERSRIYRAGLTYSQWLDRLASKSGSAFLQRPVFDRVTWARLLACGASLVVLGLVTGWFLWFVRRRAGAIESSEQQSWLALGAAACEAPACPHRVGDRRLLRFHANRGRHRLAPAPTLFIQHADCDSLCRVRYRSALARLASHPRG